MKAVNPIQDKPVETTSVPDGGELKQRTAKTVKWNVLDRVSQQVLYAVTGIILARELSQEDFGLVGALLIFQAFASLLVNSGFSFALLQRKETPSRLDYSSVLWFNLGISILIYLILFISAPLIADLFDNDLRLIPLSRVMFLTFVFNAAGIVQTNIMMKKMDVKFVAISNCVGLAAGGALGIWMAYNGYGAWALVWQAVSGALIKAAILWIGGRWLPVLKFSFKAIKSFMSISLRMLFTSFLNILFQNIFAFFIGHRVGMIPLGYYTQSDKWSKMGVTSITGVMTASFLPALSAVQDDSIRFKRVGSKMTRFTAYITFPALIWLTVMATPVFHLLFGTKWDASIILFQILLIRGIFLVLNNLYVNFLLALGKARQLIWLEVLWDASAIIALVATFPYMSVQLPDNPVWGVSVMLWVQLAVSFATWIVSLLITARYSGISVVSSLKDIAPYFLLSLISGGMMWCIVLLSLTPLVTLLIQGIIGLCVYVGILAAAGSQIQKDALAQLGLRRKSRVSVGNS